MKGDRTKRDVSITEVDTFAVAKHDRDNEYRLNWAQLSGRKPGLKVSLHRRRLPDVGKDSETNLPQSQVLTFHTAAYFNH